MKNILVVLVLIVAGCSSNIPCEKIMKEYSLISKNESDKAFELSWIQAFLKVNPLCVDGLIIRADLYNSIDSIGLAKNDYLRVVERDSFNVYGLYRLGLILQTEKKDDSAIIYFTKAIARKTHNGAVVSYKRTPGIEDRFSKYDVEYPELLFCRGTSFYVLRKLNSAEQDFNICLTNSYSLKDVCLFLGGIFYEKGDKKKACDFFTDAEIYKNPNAKRYLQLYCNN